MSMMKRLCVMLTLVVLVVSMQLSVVHCRALRSTTGADIDGCQQAVEAHQSLGMASMAVSSNNSSTRSSVGSMRFKLASGPSKRGTGH
ncbi:hypothetical protein K2173_026154 [Erythroxylum novogranatense]|uniref:Secreted protein n=1 Tax=Erythroxylum novogranatense TaxID=1862640 RepID=A0AAV8TAR5_9ROSI|nr:hypothetical protein K2173_026154 [Erythroxylum novogranatense]